MRIVSVLPLEPKQGIRRIAVYVEEETIGALHLNEFVFEVDARQDWRRESVTTVTTWIV